MPIDVEGKASFASNSKFDRDRFPLTAAFLTGRIIMQEDWR